MCGLGVDLFVFDKEFFFNFCLDMVGVLVFVRWIDEMVCMMIFVLIEVNMLIFLGYFCDVVVGCKMRCCGNCWKCVMRIEDYF